MCDRSCHKGVIWWNRWLGLEPPISAIGLTAHTPWGVEVQHREILKIQISRAWPTFQIALQCLPSGPQAGKLENACAEGALLLANWSANTGGPLSGVFYSQSLLGEGNSCGALRCKTQMCFMTCDNRFPPHPAPLGHFSSSNIRLRPSVYSALLAPLGCH